MKDGFSGGSAGGSAGGGALDVAPEDVTAAAAGVHGRAAELARAGQGVERVMRAAADEVGAPATGLALHRLRAVTVDVSTRLVAAVDALADALAAAARRYVESDRLGR